MASRSLSSIKITVKLSATTQNTLVDGSVVTAPHPELNLTPKMSSGVQNNMANRGYQLKGTLGPGDVVTLAMSDMVGIDIGAGSGVDGVGQAVDYENIMAIAIVNENEVTEEGQLEIYPHATHGWSAIGSHTVATGGALKGQGVLLKVQPVEGGFDIAALTNHRMCLRASGGTVDYGVYLLARNDDEESSSSSSVSSSQSSSSVSSSSSSFSRSLSSSSSISGHSSQSSSSSRSSQSASSASSQSSSQSSSSSSSQSSVSNS